MSAAMFNGGSARRRARAKFYQEWVFREGQFPLPCYYCRKPIYLAFRASHEGDQLRDDEATLDHLVPRARGGTNADENLVWACPKCNTEKADIRLW